MEVGQQPAHKAKFEPRRDEDSCHAGMRLEVPAGRLKRTMFQRPHYGGAGGHNAPAFADSSIQRLRGLLRERIAFAMQVNLVQPFHTKRRKGAEAHMQRNSGYLNALGNKSFQQRRRKVQSGCRRSHRTGFAREDCLIALSIRLAIVAPNVGRQRHVANLVENSEEVVYVSETEQPLAELATLQHFSRKTDGSGRRRKRQQLADAHFLPRLDQSTPAVIACRLGKEHLDQRARLPPVVDQSPPGIKPRRNHTAVVQYEQVARVEQRREFREIRVAQHAGSAIQDQHAAQAAFCRRLLRNQLLGQIEAKVGNAKASHPEAFLKCCSALSRADSIAEFNSSLLFSNSSAERSVETCVHGPQLTTIRVKGLGTMNRSQERIAQASSGSRGKQPMGALVICASLMGPILVR